MTRRVSVLVTVLAIVIAVAACGSSKSSSSSSAGGGSTAAATSASAASTAPASGTGSGGAGKDSVTNYLSYTGGKAGKANPSLPPATIGWVNQQGGTQQVGPLATTGAETAVKYINSQLGGVDGHPVVLKECFIKTADEEGRPAPNSCWPTRRSRSSTRARWPSASSPSTRRWAAPSR